MKSRFKFLMMIAFLAFSCSAGHHETTPLDPVEQNTRTLLDGWNSWNNPSVLSHVKMPEGLNIQLLLRKRRGGPYWLWDSYIASPKVNFAEKIYPGKHAYDGSYTELELYWEGQKATVRTASNDNDFYMLYTPVESPQIPYFLVFRTGILWNKPGTLQKNKGSIIAEFEGTTFTISSTSEDRAIALPLNSPYLSFYSDQKVAVYTGDVKTIEQIEELISEQEQKFDQSSEKYGDLSDAYEAMQTVMAWNLFYDAENDRALASVSRVWNEAWSGYIIFDWDTYFAALMASVDFKELAFSNAIAITNAITERGFIPNLEASHGLKSFDRSQPPVGSMVCKLIYDRYPERWFLEEVYQNLLTWNRWWDRERNNEGFLSWGSDKHPQGMEGHTLQAAKWESGLDNSPLFDDVFFNEDKEMLELASAGLMGLYVADCNYLAEIAGILGRNDDGEELKERSEKYTRKLQELWDEEAGIFRDKNLVTGKFTRHLAPTHFYPLIAKAATQEQAERMINEHFMNADEFYGEWMMPSIARNDPAYPDNTYWRGRIWAPMNFLVYMGLRNYNLPEARRILAEKSLNLILKEWNEKRRVHENYNAETGTGDDVRNSDSFYSWGGLLALIPLMEEGYLK
jgi:putative isomerase